MATFDVFETSNQIMYGMCMATFDQCYIWTMSIYVSDFCVTLILMCGRRVLQAQYYRGKGLNESLPTASGGRFAAKTGQTATYAGHTCSDETRTGGDNTLEKIGTQTCILIDKGLNWPPPK